MSISSKLDKDEKKKKARQKEIRRYDWLFTLFN